MIVERTSIFPAGCDTVLEKLQHLETLQYIAAPYAAFVPVENAVHTWTEGSTSSYRFRLFGFLPFGIHTIHIVHIGPDGIRSREGNRHVPVWNHDIRLQALDEARTAYTDRVEIHAGWKTPAVWLWASLFYRHRQKKWIRLLRKEGNR